MIRVYETLMHKLGAFHGPNYNPFALADDGAMKGFPRVLFHLMWGLWAAAIVWATAGLGVRWQWAPTFVSLVLLLSIKVNNVLKKVYRADPIDWLCDIGSGGGLGALIASHMIVGTPLPWWAFVWLALQYAVSFPWATP